MKKPSNNKVDFDELAELADGEESAEAVEVSELKDRKVAQYPLYS